MLLSREHLGFDIVSIFVNPRFSDIVLMDSKKKLNICQVSFLYAMGETAWKWSFFISSSGVFKQICTHSEVMKILWGRFRNFLSYLFAEPK